MANPTMEARPRTRRWRSWRADERQGSGRGKQAQVTGTLDSVDLMHRLLSVLDLDPGDVPAGIFQDLCRACAACRHRSLCEHDLTSGRSERCYQAYCPSAHTLGTLRALERARKRLSID